MVDAHALSNQSVAPGMFIACHWWSDGIGDLTKTKNESSVCQQGLLSLKLVKIKKANEEREGKRQGWRGRGGKPKVISVR